MLNNIKTALFRVSDMSWGSLIKLKAWLSFNNFDMQTFNSPTLRVAQATNQQGEPVAFVALQNVFLLSGYAVSPTVNPSDAQRAGDELDAAIAHAAQCAGINKCLIVMPAGHPGFPGEETEELRVYVRKVPSAVNTHGIEQSTKSHASQYVH